MAFLKSTILIIEDEEVLLSALTEKLQHAGYTVTGAKDGAVGLDLIRTNKPDLILLDILLPKKNGFEILDEVNKDKEISKIPIIVISNSGQPVEIKKLLALGVRDYLVKAEFDPGEVLEKIQKILGYQPAELRDASITRNAASAPKATQMNNNKKGEMILVVEDDKFLRDLIVEKLDREGFVVKEAIDGNQAMKLLETEKPNIILLDLILPGIDGFEILRRIKNDPAVSKIPIIVLSNLGQQEDIDRAKELGAKYYLIKAHFTLGEILEKIRTVLKESYF